jgi:hypothetical protein
MKFIPDKPAEGAERIVVPYFENVRSDDSPGYSTGRSMESLQKEAVALFARLGAYRVAFQQGRFDTKPIRHGMVVTFWLDGNEGRLTVAALPFLHAETPKKVEQALKHAMFNVILMLKSQIQTQIFSPGTNPLIQYLLTSGGDRTIGEELTERLYIQDRNPALPARVGER